MTDDTDPTKWTDKRRQQEERKALKAQGRFYGNPNHFKGYWKHGDRPVYKKKFHVPRMLPDGTVKQPGE